MRRESLVEVCSSIRNEGNQETYHSTVAEQCIRDTGYEGQMPEEWRVPISDQGDGRVYRPTAAEQAIRGTAYESLRDEWLGEWCPPVSGQWRWRKISSDRRQPNHLWHRL